MLILISLDHGITKRHSQLEPIPRSLDLQTTANPFDESMSSDEEKLKNDTRESDHAET